jgi:hypothetical protein
MLGHLLRQKLDLCDSATDAVSTVSYPSSLLSSRTSSGVCSVAGLDGAECRERDDRPDLWEAGRALDAVESIM